ncbi:MAG: RNA polymerase sigma factor [Sterolibacteriaceae bacterium]|nr:RNA polymerase sigma factor [Sterolibacteriaceae bacterium]MBK9085796.1 RNA polymerase sigma factor [Sterolibacteriaceae bacterium]
MDVERSDEALMLAYRDGDARAFEFLYQRHRSRLYRWLTHQCGSAGIAEELYQDIWLKVINARDGYQVSARFTTWLFRIAHNRLVDHWRASGRAPSAVGPPDDDDADDPLDLVAGSPLEEPHNEFERKRLGAALIRQIEALPAVQRETFLLAQETDMTLEEIASITGVNRETAKSRMRYALAKLRDGLRDWQ